MALLGRLLRRCCHSLAVAAVLGYEVVVYNIIFLGIILPAAGKERLAPRLFAAFNFAFGMALWCYWRARVVDAGKVPQSWHDFVVSVGEALPVQPARFEWQPGRATYCSQCGVPRPDRAHHCRLCGTCILRMDHHCPWLNNCVGFCNQKMFMLSLAYGVLACVVAVAATFPELLAAANMVMRQQEGLAVQHRGLVPAAAVHAFLLWGALAALLLVLLSIMLAAHVELLVHNATTIEGHYCNMPNPFDQSSSYENAAQVFGGFGIDWFLPIAPWRPRTDGVSFERTDERLVDDKGGSSCVFDPRGGNERLWRLRYRVGSGSRDPERGLLSSLLWGASSTPCETSCGDKELPPAGPRGWAPTRSIIEL